MAIYGIDGDFGSGKTSFGAYLAKNSPKTHIWTNIKMNDFAIQNYHYFNDDSFIETMRTINLINDIERIEAGYMVEGNSLIRRHRNMFSRHIILFDEIGAIQNNRNWKNIETVQTEYINQNRKNMTDIFLITADGTQAEKSLRRFAEWWYYSKPLFNFSIFKDFKIVRKQKRDDEGKIMTESYLGRDEQGQEVIKQKPMDYFQDWYYQPLVWSYYDDLHKNIKDPDKYLVNLKILEDFIKKEPKLGLLLQENFPLFFEKNNLLLEPNLN